MCSEFSRAGSTYSDDIMFASQQSQYVSDIRTSVIYQNGSPEKIILDYVMSDPGQSGTKKEKNTGGLDNALISDNQAEKWGPWIDGVVEVHRKSTVFHLIAAGVNQTVQCPYTSTYFWGVIFLNTSNDSCPYHFTLSITILIISLC